MKGKAPKTEARRRGDLGEAAAVRYLRRRLYRVLDRNWFFYHKEIDVVARRGRTLVICEVKTRTSYAPSPLSYGTPSSAVDAKKRQNLLTAAGAYVRRIGWQGDVRFDVIEVYLKGRGHRRPRIERIEHIQNAFTA